MPLPTAQLCSDESTHEIERFFKAFCVAFSEFDGALIAQRYATPYTALNAEGTIQVFSTQAQIALYFQGILNDYHRQGCRSCQFKDLRVVPLGHTSALASVTWELLTGQHAVASTWRESYNLTREGNGFRIFASTDHATEAIPPRTWAPPPFPD